MKPADPLISTFSIRCALPSCADLLRRQPAAEREPVPPQVARYPLGDLEVRHSRLAVEPDRRDLRDWQPEALRLGGELDSNLESRPRVDADLAAELPPACL